MLTRIFRTPIKLSQQLFFNYHEKVIDHYENPRNVGSLDRNKKNVGTGLVGAPACGDVMKLQIEVDEDGKTIQKAVFKVHFTIYLDFWLWQCHRFELLRDRNYQRHVNR